MTFLITEVEAMEKTILNFKADGQKLTVDKADGFAVNTVNYIEAHFELGNNWDFEIVRAVWTNKVVTIATQLVNGVCIVPWELLTKKYPVRVNLVGSVFDGSTLADRLTTEQIVAFTLNKDALISGNEESEITPTIFEQFVAEVKADADRAEASAARAEEAESHITRISFHIDENGCLIQEEEDV